MQQRLIPLLIYKKYNSSFIINNFKFEFSSSFIYGISGPNGSGKSTLLKLIASTEHQNKGSISYLSQNRYITENNIYKYLSIVAPYTEISDYLTLEESIDLHFKFKNYIDEFNKYKILDNIQMSELSNHLIGTFSSGMKQKVKLALAILSNSKILLLDEPTMNLDLNTIKWFQNLVCDFAKERLIIIFSNNRNEELSLCSEVINIEKFK